MVAREMAVSGALVMGAKRVGEMNGAR